MGAGSGDPRPGPDGGTPAGSGTEKDSVDRKNPAPFTVEGRRVFLYSYGSMAPDSRSINSAS